MQTQGVRITQGRILPNIIRFAIPIVFSNILQITFNAVDVAVVGWFCGSNAVASVGATTSLIHLLLNLFIGLATGTNIAVSFSLGMENREEAGKHAHNAVAVSLFSGVVVALLALWMARPALTAMATPAGEILDGAVLYFRIYFLGAPFLLLYNFGSAILRANGDSERPFLYLSLGGVANVILNIVLVLVFDMTVDGVAIATVLSNMISASLVFRHLLRMEGPLPSYAEENSDSQKDVLNRFEVWSAGRNPELYVFTPQSNDSIFYQYLRCGSGCRKHSGNQCLWIL